MNTSCESSYVNTPPTPTPSLPLSISLSLSLSLIWLQSELQFTSAKQTAGQPVHLRALNHSGSRGRLDRGGEKEGEGKQNKITTLNHIFTMMPHILQGGNSSGILSVNKAFCDIWIRQSDWKI